MAFLAFRLQEKLGLEY